MENIKTFGKIQEVRRPKKCPVTNFKPIRESEVYKDMMALGFVERLSDNPVGVEVAGTEEQRYFKDRLGNIAFFHPQLQGYKSGFPYYNIMHNGSIKVWTGTSKSSELPFLSTDLTKVCMTVEDYLFKMGFLIKYYLRKKGLNFSNDELYGNESYKELILRKMKENPEIVQKFEIPPSLKGEDLSKGASILKRLGAFGD